MGLPLAVWAGGLEDAGVNLIDLNLEPREKLQTAGMSELGSAYIDAIANDPDRRTQDQERVVSEFDDQRVPLFQYSVEERNAILLRFLRRLEDLRQSGQIKGNFKVLLHQRQWFRPGEASNAVEARSRRVADFSTDMADFVNEARAQCLDSWIEGVRLGENFNTDMNEYLSVLTGIARGINERSGGWLASHLFIANGGGMGAEYHDIDRHQAFFADMSRETGAFAFGYKWMQFTDRDHKFIARNIGESTCGERACSAKSVADWKTFLGDQLGFYDLEKLIEQNHASYPNHANVVFVGDGSDSVTLMVDRTKGGLGYAAQMKALREMWPREDGWRGKVFMNAYMDLHTLPPDRRARPDTGMSLLLSNDRGSAEPMSRSTEIWRDWP